MVNWLLNQNIFGLCKYTIIGIGIKKPEQHVITVPTHTILHPQLEVNAVTNINAIPTSVCNRTQEKSIPVQPVCLTDSDCDYIWEEIGCREKIYLKRDVEVYSADEEN